MAETTVWELLARFRTTGLTELERGLASSSGKLKQFGDRTSAVGAKMTKFVTLPILGAGVAAVKFASDAEETRNRVNVIFGGMAESVVKWSDTSIEKMGAANFTAQNMASTFGNLFQSAGLVGGELANTSTKFAQLTADASSFFNVDFETALQKLRSGLVGESEPLRDFGVFLTEAAVAAEAVRIGLVKTGEEMTEQQKIMARASLITKGLTQASGDFERTSSSMANQTRQTVERLKEMAAEVGADLIPIGQQLLTVVQGWLKAFMDLSPETRQTILKFAAMAAALGPLLFIVGKLTSGFGLLLGFLTKTGTAAGAAGKATGGLVTRLGALVRGGAIFLGVAALADMVWTLYQNTKLTEEAQRDLNRALGESDPGKGLKPLLGVTTELEAKIGNLRKRLDEINIVADQGTRGPMDVWNKFVDIVADVGPWDSAREAVAGVRGELKATLHEALDRLPGVWSQTRQNMIDVRIASEDYAGALKLINMWEQQWLGSVKDSQRGMKELTTEYDRLMRTQANATEATRRESRERREASRQARVHADNMNDLEASIRGVMGVSPVTTKYNINIDPELMKLAELFRQNPELLKGGVNTSVKESHEGGMIGGRGSGQEVLRKLLTGEFVMRREAVQMYGPDFFEALNKGTDLHAGGQVHDASHFTQSYREQLKLLDYVRTISAKLAPGFAPFVGTGSIVAVGHAMQRMGYLVGEHPAFGGVAPVHVPNSYHYRGRAVDVNWPGVGEIEKLNTLAGWVRANVNPITELFYPGSDPVGGHSGHLHLAMHQGGFVPEPGEFVVRKQMAKPYAPVLEAMNTGKLGSLRGVEVVGTLNTPFGPATIRGMIQDEIVETERMRYRSVLTRGGA